MKKYWLVLLLINLCFSRANAQPGGGGGLIIHQLFNSDLEPIYLGKDSLLRIRIFVLREGEIYEECYRAKNSPMGTNRYGNEFLFLPPSVGDFYPNGFAPQGADYRLLFTYKQDTMLLDILGVCNPNPMGYVGTVDTLVIQQGYYVHTRPNRIAEDFNWSKYKHLRPYFDYGLSYSSTEILRKYGFFSTEEDIDLEFPEEQNLPISYHLGLAKYLISKDQHQEALNELSTAIDKNLGERNCEMLYLLHTCHLKLQSYDKALENISAALDCNPYPSYMQDWEAAVSNYQAAIKIYLLQGRFEEAKEAHEKILSISRNKISAHIDYADFKRRHLNDAKGALKLLHSIVDTISNSHLNDRPGGYSQYANTYFALGQAAYAKGKRKRAYQHWLKAMEFGYGQSSSTAAVDHFDSLIQRHPKAAELYLSRALAQYKRAPYLGWGDQTKTCFKEALEDVETAQKQGFSDYRIHMYRAKLLNALKRHEEALIAINTAIDMHETDPRTFAIRIHIRDKLCDVIWGNENDPDLLRYKALCKDWNWHDN